MRHFSDLEIHRIELLTKHSIELTVIEPTETGLRKSIIDATGPVRTFLMEKLIHDYHSQKQGPQNKIQKVAWLVEDNKLTQSIVSFYRPNTKNGDPRIWFKGLGGYVQPKEILVLFIFEGNLYVLNITKLDVQQLLRGESINPLQELLKANSEIVNESAVELLMILRKIASRGPIPGLLKADTSIGRTLESLLGIPINSSKNPDYKGIELKSFRESRTNRKNLFAQVPDWSISKFKSSSEILNNFGYMRQLDLKLYCTVSTLIRNSQGLILKLDSNTNQLVENSKKDEIGDFAVWSLTTLHKRLLEKHNETFWITAKPLFLDGKEYFEFNKIEHTRKPIVSQFDILLEQGIITLDHLIKRNAIGKVVEKGPLFKIKPNSIGLLFPPSKQYSLVT